MKNNARALLFNMVRIPATLCFVTMLVLIMMSIILRKFPVIHYAGWDEVVELCFAWMIYLTIGLAVLDATIFRASGLVDVVTGKLRVIVRIISELFVFLFGLIMFYSGITFAFGVEQYSGLLWIPRWVFWSTIPVAGFMILIFALYRIYIIIINGSDNEVDKDLSEKYKDNI